MLALLLSSLCLASDLLAPVPRFDSLATSDVQPLSRRAAGAEPAVLMPSRLDPFLRTRLAPGEADTLRVRGALIAVVDSLVAQGHLLARLSADSLDSVRGATTLHVSSTIGPRFSWSDLEQDGSRLRPLTLARAARWKTGGEADPARLETALSRLENTGWVRRTAAPDFIREPRSLRLRGRLHLQDLPTSQIEAVGGWTSGGDPTGHLLAELVDLLGTGRGLLFSITQEEDGSQARAVWTEPWLGPIDVALKLGVEMESDSLVHSTRLWGDFEGSPGDGRLTLSAGLGWWRYTERTLDDTVFGPPETETSTRLGARGWIGDRDGFWPTRRLEASLSTETVTLRSHLGRFRARHALEATYPLCGPVLLQARWGLAGLWPLESATPLAEYASPGGLDGWHGWREGTPWTPSWAYGALELRVGSGRQGGLRAFWEPGAWWVRRASDQQWEARATWTAGGGIRLRAGAWEIDCLVAGERDTPSWEDALVHLRARNRF